MITVTNEYQFQIVNEGIRSEIRDFTRIDRKPKSWMDLCAIPKKTWVSSAKQSLNKYGKLVAIGLNPTNEQKKNVRQLRQLVNAIA